MKSFNVIIQMKVSEQFVTVVPITKTFSKKKMKINLGAVQNERIKMLSLSGGIKELKELDIRTSFRRCLSVDFHLTSEHVL